MLARFVSIAVVAVVWLSACEKTDHGSIDKWLGTKKGPGKLKRACTDEGIDSDLSAHACVNMIKSGRDQEVRTELGGLTQARKEQVVAKMAPRLWEIARVEGEMQLPVPGQTQAKDALVMLRTMA